jgi:hypothetical protein
MLQVRLLFIYYGLCPASACGSNSLPQRGYCVFGNCQCINSWTSSDCSVIGSAPSIIPVNAVVLTEGQNYQLQLNITQVKSFPQTSRQCIMVAYFKGSFFVKSLAYVRWHVRFCQFAIVNALIMTWLLSFTNHDVRPFMRQNSFGEYV